MSSNAPGESPADAVQRARAQARRRLIGAVVLVGIGIVAFPLLFETQPRPIPVDLPIVIPKKDAVPPLTPPSPQAAVKPRDDGNAASSAQEPREAAATPTEPPQSQPQAEAKAPARGGDADAERARALLEGKATARSEAAATPTRMVVQVGAFADPAAVRGVRKRVEQIGLKTFVQEVQTDGGKRLRVRVGPFDSRDDAEKAAARIKAAGLPAAVMTP